MRCISLHGVAVIVSNGKRFFNGGYLGVIRSAFFICTVQTSKGGRDQLPSILIFSTNERGEPSSHEAVAEAVVSPKVVGEALRALHDAVVSSIDGSGSSGEDFATAIERAFGDAKRGGLVETYLNSAFFLLAARSA